MFLISCWSLSVCCQTQSRSGRPWEKDWSLTLRQRCHLSTTRDRAMRDLSEYSSHTPTHTHTLVLVQLIPKASPGQLPPMCVMTHRTTNIWTVLAIVSKILAQHGSLSLMCLLLFCRSLFSSTESGNSSVLGVVKYFSVHFLHVMLNVPYQTSWIILLFFSLGFSGVGRTVWRVRAQRPSFHTSWYERDSWRVSI